MESPWEEKKIQALFSELRTADEQIAPSFAATWNRATLAPRRIRALNFAFVAATALLFCALISLAVWSRYSQRTQPPLAKAVTPPSVVNTAPTTIATNSGSELKPEVKPSRATARPHNFKPAASRRDNVLVAANRKLTQEAKAIAGWQSPTSELLSSPSDEIFNSLPQLNQSSSELKSFLPGRAN